MYNIRKREDLINEAAEKWLHLVELGWQIKKNSPSKALFYNGKISQRQFKILGALEFTKLNTISELAEKMHISKSTLSIIISKMIKSGYVTKSRPDNEPDKRKVYFYPTEKGIEILKAKSEANTNNFKAFYNSISPHQRENFRKAVNILRGLTPERQECTEALVKRYISVNSTDEDSEFSALLEDLSFFLLSVLEKNANQYCSYAQLDNVDGIKNITHNQYQILFCISSLGLNTISKLSEFLGSSGSTLSIMVSKLVKSGFLQKSYPNTLQDNRFVYISPTEKTKKLLNETALFANEQIKQNYLMTLSTEELEKLMEGMDYFIKVFQK